MNLLFEKRVLRTATEDGLPMELVSWDSFHHLQPFRHSVTPAAVVQWGFAFI